MLTGEAYSSGQLVPSHLGLAYVLFVETNPFPELIIFPAFSLRTTVGTFSILPDNGHIVCIQGLLFEYHQCLETLLSLSKCFPFCSVY